MDEDTERAVILERGDDEAKAETRRLTTRIFSVCVVAITGIFVLLGCRQQSATHPDFKEGPYRSLPSGNLSTAFPGFPADASIAEAVRRQHFLLRTREGFEASRTGKAISNKIGATSVDVVPDVWYAYAPAHSASCADAELVAGVWTCGIRRLQCNCVAYVFSHGSGFAFADELEALTPCDVYRFGPDAGSLLNVTLSSVDGDRLPEELASDLGNMLR